MKRINIFLAHSIHDSPAKIKDIARAIRGTFEGKFLASSGFSPAISITSGRSDHKIHWRGSWEDWELSVLNRKNVTTGKLAYDMFVTTAKTCGKSTASILREAVRTKRPVYLWDTTLGCKKVVGIENRDEEDWANGFHIMLEPKQLNLFGDTHEAHN